MARNRRLIAIDTHREVFSWVLGLLAERGLLKGLRMGMDATILEAHAAMRSIVRGDTGEMCDEFLCGLPFSLSSSSHRGSLLLSEVQTNLTS
jgi:hypothetical protein